MNKLLSFIFLIFIATLLGGLYGIVHDQITYTISPEYFTKFKFHQFGFADQEPELVRDLPRLCVGIIGFMATWWFGLLLGMVLALVGSMLPKRRYFKLVSKSILLALIIAVVTAFLGGIYAYLFVDTIPTYWYIPEGLVDQKSFIITGSIHNASYTGGALGTLIGIVFLIYKRKTLN